MSGVGIDEHVQVVRTSAHPLGAAVLWCHQDARGSVVAVTNAAGAVVERAMFDDFGRQIGGGAQPHGFQSRYRDAETGWVTMWKPATSGDALRLQRIAMHLWSKTPLPDLDGNEVRYYFHIPAVQPAIARTGERLGTLFMWCKESGLTHHISHAEVPDWWPSVVPQDGLSGDGQQFFDSLERAWIDGRLPRLPCKRR